MKEVFFGVLLIRNLTRENLIDCVNFWCQLKNDREFIFRSFHILASSLIYYRENKSGLIRVL